MPFDFHSDQTRFDAVQLDFDFGSAPKSVAAKPAKTRQCLNYHAGLSAEDSVRRHYVRQGADLKEQRWKGPGGEIDLILCEGDRVVFVEVKKSKTHARAVDRVTHRQMGRIRASAEAYLDRCPMGSLTDMRIDVALVDAQGVVQIVENAGMAA